MFGVVTTPLYYVLIYPPATLLHFAIVKPLVLIIYYINIPFKYFFIFSYNFTTLLLEIARSFETIVIFVSVAAIVGICSGGLLYLASKVIISILGWISSRQTAVNLPPRTIADYREERQRKRDLSAMKQDLMMGKPLTVPWVTRDVDDLTSQTIVEEEEDSDF